jgi:hypothetical protein
VCQHGSLVRAENRQHVGQVVLALGVVGSHLGERSHQSRAIEGEYARVDLTDVELQLGRVARGLGLDDPHHGPVGTTHDPPVAGRILEHDGRDRRRRARACMSLRESVDRLRTDQRHIAVDHHYRVGRPDVCGRRPDRVGGAKRLLLDCDRDVAVKRGLESPLGSIDHHDPLGSRRPGGGHRPRDHRTTAQRVQQLGHG